MVQMGGRSLRVSVCVCVGEQGEVAGLEEALWISKRAAADHESTAMEEPAGNAPAGAREAAPPGAGGWKNHVPSVRPRGYR